MDRGGKVSASDLEIEGEHEAALDVYNESYEQSRAFVPSQIARARYLIQHQRYEELVAQCQGEGSLQGCPILDSLDEQTR